MNPLAILWLVELVTLATAAPAFAEDAPGDVARGKTAYERHLSRPGHAWGPFAPGAASLEVKYRGREPAALEDCTVRGLGMLVIRRGSQGMPFFRPPEVSNQDLLDIAAYLSRKTKKHGDGPVAQKNQTLGFKLCSAKI
jgi:hypothetical protein